MLSKDFKIIPFLVGIPLVLMSMGWTPVSSPQHNTNGVHCQLFGSVFFTKKAGEADFVVFVEEQESFADLVVFPETSAGFAVSQGHWHRVEEPFLSDFRIYITANLSEADFTIAYTDIESFAGCNP